MRRVWFIVLIAVLLASCGYKPTNIYTKKILGDSIYVDVSISKVDPQNSILIVDAINQAVITKFRSKLVKDKSRATSKMYISLKSVSFKPIQYDQNGYVIAYKTLVSLETRYIDRNGKQRVITSSGDYDFSIEANSIISDNKRFDAIKYGASKAIDELISKISVRGVMSEKE